MIVKEYYKTRSDGVNLYRSYSDEGYRIRKTGTEEIYDEAIDVEDSIFVYEEIDESIEELSTEETLDIILGGNV